VRVPFVPVLVGIVALGVILLFALGLRIRAALRRFGRVRGWLDDYLADRTGMLAARRAALGIAVFDLKQDLLRHRSTAGAPRTIGDSEEREDNRA
jgi:hypothetical protein